jgi:hypothetical protein
VAQPEKQIKDKKLYAPSGKSQTEHTVSVIEIASSHSNLKQSR